MKRNLENEIWGKTLLSLYRYLEKMANSIDNLVKKIGINSVFNHYTYNSTYSDSNKIIELTDRKQKIINLKVIIEKGLVQLSENDIKILNLCFVDNVNYKTIQKLLNISERTFFRRKEMAIARFSHAICSMGYNSEKLFDYLKNENWILNTYKQTLNNVATFVNNNNKKEQYKLLKLVLNDFNNSYNHSYSYY